MINQWQEAWENETSARTSVDPAKICTFGVKPLDDALIGFLPDDLVVIAADSGTGKTQIGIDIAVHNAMNGKNVALYPIEGNDDGAISRIKWKVMRNMYYQNNRNDIDWDYRKWRMNMANTPAMIQLEIDAMKYLNDKMGNRLHMYHANKGFTLNDFKNSLGWFVKSKETTEFLPENFIDIDLLIIDHLQYFTLESTANEFVETTEILREVKNIAEFHKIPVLLISHLRKKEKNRGLPNQEDLFGTSNIAKICSQCIVLAPSYANTDYYNDIYPTYFRFVKSRTGLKSSYAILSDFHLKTGGYDDKYKMFHVIENQPKDEFKPHQLPKWAYKSPEVPVANFND